MDHSFEVKLYAHGLCTESVDYLRMEGIDRFIFYDLEPIHLIDAPIRLRDKLLIARLIRLAKEKGKAYRDEVQSTSDSEDFDNL